LEWENNQLYRIDHHSTLEIFEKSLKRVVGLPMDEDSDSEIGVASLLAPSTDNDESRAFAPLSEPPLSRPCPSRHTGARETTFPSPSPSPCPHHRAKTARLLLPPVARQHPSRSCVWLRIPSVVRGKRCSSNCLAGLVQFYYPSVGEDKYLCRQTISFRLMTLCFLRDSSDSRPCFWSSFLCYR